MQKQYISHSFSNLRTYVILCTTQLQVRLERHISTEIFLDEKISAIFSPPSTDLGRKWGVLTAATTTSKQWGTVNSTMHISTAEIDVWSSVPLINSA